MILYQSGLPITADEKTGELSFYDGLRCQSFSEKSVGQMHSLFKNDAGADPEQPVYRAFRNIRFPEDEALFQRYHYRYDITVIRPGTVNGEFYKTSGHFHEVVPGMVHPYPEVYEVICGEVVFVLQRSTSFAGADCGDIREVRAVHVKAGEAVIIPPWWGHGAVNPTKGISAFSNIAVVPCPLDYNAVRAKQGLAAYILEDGSTFRAERNAHYGEIPDPALVRPKERDALGITFGFPCYANFVRNPERYDFLAHPEKSLEEMEAMSAPE